MEKGMIYFLILCVCVPECMECTVGMWETMGVHQRGVSDHLELGWVLGTEPESCAGVVNTLNHFPSPSIRL